MKVEIESLLGIACPYKFFASLCHLCVRHKKMLIGLSVRHVANPFVEKVRENGMGIHLDELNRIDFPPAFYDLLSNGVHTEGQAGLFLIALLEETDKLLADHFSKQDENPKDINKKIYKAKKRPPGARKIGNPNYYKPIAIDGTPSEYIIVPKIPSLFSQWIDEENRLEKEEAYYNSSIFSHFLEYHSVIEKNDDFIVTRGDSPVSRAFHKNLEGLSKLTIGLAPFDHGFEFTPVVYMEEAMADKVPFRYSAIEKPSREEIKKRLEDILQDALEKEVDILVFPELTVDHDAFSVISKWIAANNSKTGLKLVVAGSFHSEHSDGDFVNRSAMLDWQGNAVWRHCKTLPFTLSSNQIEKSQNKEEIRKRFGVREKQDLKERIYTACPITFFDTPIGRMATLVCLDFMNKEVASILTQISCDYFWVPAMTPNISDFRTEASYNFGKKGHALSAICASVSIGEMLDISPRPFSFAYAPSKKFKETVQGTQSDKSALIIYEIHKMV